MEPSIAAVEAAATVDGVRLAALAEELPVARSSVFELLKAFRIVTTKGPGTGGKGRAAWVSDADAEKLRAAARAVHAGEKKIIDFSSAISPSTSKGTKKTLSADSADSSPFLSRLKAAEKAVSSGLGLTTAEATWILGVIPGSSPLTRGGIIATRTGKNCWLLSRASQP